MRGEFLEFKGSQQLTGSKIVKKLFNWVIINKVIIIHIIAEPVILTSYS